MPSTSVSVIPNRTRLKFAAVTPGDQNSPFATPSARATTHSVTPNHVSRRQPSLLMDQALHVDRAPGARTAPPAPCPRRRSPQRQSPPDCTRCSASRPRRVRPWQGRSSPPRHLALAPGRPTPARPSCRSGWRRPWPPSPMAGTASQPRARTAVPARRKRRQVARRCGEGGDELVEEDITQPLEGLDGDGVLEAREGGLTRQVRVIRGAVGDELEDGIAAQGVVVVLVLVAGEDAVDAAANHLQEGVFGEVGVVEGVGEGPGEPDALIRLADGEQAGVAGELAW